MSLVWSLVLSAPVRAVDVNRRGVLAGLSSLALRPKLRPPIVPAATLEDLDAGLRPEMWRQNPQVNGMLRDLAAGEVEAVQNRLIALERALPAQLGVRPEVVRQFFNRTFFICAQERPQHLPLAEHQGRVIAAVRDIRAELGELLETWVTAVRDYEREYPANINGSVLDWRHRIWATPKMNNVILRTGRATSIWDPAFKQIKVKVVAAIDDLERAVARESGLPLEVIWEHSFYLDVDRAQYPRQFVELPPVNVRLRRGLEGILPSFNKELSGEDVPRTPAPRASVPHASLRLEVTRLLRSRGTAADDVTSEPTVPAPALPCELLLEHQRVVPLAGEMPEAAHVNFSESLSADVLRPEPLRRPE